jgi:hypothetical protein
MKTVLGGAAAILSILLFLKGRETDWWINLLAVGFVMSFLFGWPKTIVTDQRGVECLWWWRRKVFIPWEQVEYAETGAVGAIEIVGTHGRIKFEGYNVDPDRFCNEVIARSNVKKIVTPEEFTGLKL